MKRIVVLGCLVAAIAHAADFVPEARTGAAIQKAIDAASAAGGGRVALERGAVYPSGTLYLKSWVELNVPEGTVILGGGSPEDYDDVDDPRIGRKPEKTIIMSNVEGIRFDRFTVCSGVGKKTPPAVNSSDGWERGNK